MCQIAVRATEINRTMNADILLRRCDTGINCLHVYRIMAESGSPSILVVTGINKKKDLIMVSREVVVSGQKLGGRRTCQDIKNFHSNQR